MAPPRIVVGPDDLAPYFTEATIARGVRYADERRIEEVFWEDDGRTLTGRCYGSGDHIYGVDVCLQHVGPHPVIEWTDCTCPVGAFCKHAVALLLTAAADAAAPADPDPRRWRVVLTQVLDEIPTPVMDTGGSPIGLEFSLAPPTRYRPGETIALRPVTIGKRGTWIKRGLSWQHLLYDSDSGRFNRRQYHAVRALAVEVQRSGAMYYGETWFLAGTSTVLWPKLKDAEDAGVAMVADKSSGLAAVEFIKSASCAWFSPPTPPAGRPYPWHWFSTVRSATRPGWA